jgi:putative cell wall-binding protein
VVSDAIKDRLGDGYTYERIGGADRYETSVQVAAWSAARGLGFSG